MDAKTPTGVAHVAVRKLVSAQTGSVRAAMSRRPAKVLLPPGARGLVICATASALRRSGGRSAVSTARSQDPRHASLSRLLAEHRLASLFVDLLDESDLEVGQGRGDLALLAARVVEALDRASARAERAGLRTGLWATGTAAAACLIAATQRSALVAAVVSCSGRPDLAGPALARVAVPTLLIVGGNDPEALASNRAAMLDLSCEKRLEVVPGAARAFEEPGAWEAMAHLTGAWLAGRLAVGLARD